jgi:hypothetical protein
MTKKVAWAFRPGSQTVKEAQMTISKHCRAMALGKNIIRKSTPSMFFLAFAACRSARKSRRETPPPVF